MAAPPPWRATASSGSYTTVNARRNFDTPKTNGYTSTTPQPQSAPSNGRTTFPDPLKQYVARTFEDVLPENRVEVEAELKRIITEAFNEKVVWSIDWDKMPLPQARLAMRVAPKEDTNKLHSPTTALGKFSLSERKRKSTGDGEVSNLKQVETGEKRARQESPQTFSTDKLSQRDKDKRAQRFAKEFKASKALSERITPMDVDDNRPLVGRCTKLEKRYLRLTAAPNPDNVRPLHILKQTLELLKQKWREEQNYSYICDQFKSLRQDLTVQHIKNDFTVAVYEIHARIALEKGDLGEYNQCQSQLAALYSEGFRGNEQEFKAYRILYLIHTCNRSDMSEMLALLTPTDKKHSFVKHALQVRSQLAGGNYHAFFKLYLEAPGMGGYLMDSFVARERMAALAIICKAYRPDIDVRFLTEELGFESDAECVQFLYDNGASHLITQKTDDKGVPNSIRFQTSQAIPIFEQAKQQAFKKVDIKGQM